jgi:hypothetical protein
MLTWGFTQSLLTLFPCKKRSYEGKDAQEDQQGRPVPGNIVLQTKMRAKGEEHDCTDQNKDQATRINLFQIPVDDTTQDDARAYKAGDECPDVRPTVPISGHVLVIQDAADP